jgi:hypothetical protein
MVDEINGDKPQAGEKILLVILTQPGLVKMDPDDFSLEGLSNMMHDNSQGEIYISGNDGSRAISTMGGWVEGEFVLV